MRLSRTILVRLTEPEYDAVVALADDLGVKRAQYLRRLVRDHLVRHELADMRSTVAS